MGKWDKYKKNKPEKNDSNSLNNGMGKTVINCLSKISISTGAKAL